MENRFKHDIEMERLRKEFADAVYSLLLLVSIAIVVLQFGSFLF